MTPAGCPPIQFQYIIHLEIVSAPTGWGLSPQNLFLPAHLSQVQASWSSLQVVQVNRFISLLQRIFQSLQINSQKKRYLGAGLEGSWAQEALSPSECTIPTGWEFLSLLSVSTCSAIQKFLQTLSSWTFMRLHWIAWWKHEQPCWKYIWMQNILIDWMGNPAKACLFRFLLGLSLCSALPSSREADSVMRVLWPTVRLESCLG